MGDVETILQTIIEDLEEGPMPSFEKQDLIERLEAVIEALPVDVLQLSVYNEEMAYED